MSPHQETRSATRPSRVAMLAIGFAVAAAILIAAGADHLVRARQTIKQHELASNAYRENRTAAQLVTRLIADWLEQRDQWGHGVARTWPSDFELDVVAVPALEAEITDRIAALGFVKIHLFNRDGRTIFSTDRSDMGKPTTSPARFAAALAGTSQSSTEFHERFLAFDGERERVWIVSTYAAMRIAAANTGTPDAVLELSSDVTATVERVEADLASEVVVIVGVFGAIYVPLVVLVAIGARSLMRTQIALAVAKQAAEENERRFRDFAIVASDWFWETDAEGRFTYVSDGITRYGVQPSHFIGRSRDDMPEHIDPGAAGFREVKAATARREAFKDVEIPVAFVAGNPATVSLSGRPVFAEDGTYLGHRGSGRDVTEIHAANRRLETALDRERDAAAHQKRFVSVTAHEFRTPLTIIDGAAQRLSRYADRLTAQDLRDRVDRIRKAVAQMATIIDKTLNSAKLEAGQIDVNRARLDLVDLLRRACERQQSLAPDFELVFAPVCETAAVDGDAQLLDQVFVNLLSNAVKYSGTSRRIDVALSLEPGQAVVRVRDRGVGIPREELPKLFSRYFRASTAKGIPGTGIGLNLVKELLLLNDGDVGVESAPDRGTCFVVRLPLASTPQQHVAAAPAA